MSRIKSSSIATAFLALACCLSANPVLIAEWNWTDSFGILHAFEAFRYEHQTWDAANLKATNGWYLATITDETEQAALTEGLAGITGEFWLGGSQAKGDKAPEDNWQWQTGETWDYKNWAPGEPNDAYGCATEQHLATWSRWGTDRWLWNDEGYLPNITGYITEQSQSVPEPALLVLVCIGLPALYGFAYIMKV